MNKAGRKIVKTVENLVGFRGTIAEIEARLGSFMGIGCTASLEPFSEDNSVDIGYVANLGMSGDDYLDFDIFVLETREKDVLYITEVTFIG